MGIPRPRLTLGRFIGLGFAALALVLVALLSLFYGGSRQTILLASEQLMRQASRRVGERLDAHLAEAELVVATLEAAAAEGLLRADVLEPLLLGLLHAHPALTDLTFTAGGDAGQLSVARLDDTVRVRRVRAADDGWRADESTVAADGARRPRGSSPALDPTAHATFTTPALAEFRGQALWSDLAFYEVDGALPESERRRVVSVQKALWSRTGAFVGVARVALHSDRIDDLVRVTVDDAADDDGATVFLCDRFGRLISRLSPADRFGLLAPDGTADPENGDVRVLPAALPPAVAAALAAPSIHAAGGGEPSIDRLEVDGVTFLGSVAPVLGARTQGWLVGVVVPESRYLGSLAAARRRALAVAVLVGMLTAAGAGLGLRALRRDLGRLLDETTRLRSFDFTPARAAPATFHDVRAAAQGLDQAKTALRALGKYAPLDLVRDLWDAHREPVLGAELRDVTILFADVAGFTGIAERLPPDELATALGAYLDAMTRAVHATGGIIDKYTGDGLMALWNTPRPLDEHAARACEAALACRDAATALFASPAWRGRAPWTTRFGIHRAEVTVGHFGAPDRMSFTAMGDGVNLAARLESLGKQYGVALVVSDEVVRAAGERFWFRRLDRVAVKGKETSVTIHELVGRRHPGDAPPPIVAAYEAALAAYASGDFTAALARFEACAGDPPSRALADRCRAYRADPPSRFDGTFTLTVK